MFERFTDGARAVVVGAQGEARRLNHGFIGTEHLLLALLAEENDTLPKRVLGHHGLDHARASAMLGPMIGTAESDELDAELLSALGIDLGAVREKVEATFGPGALDRPSVQPRKGPLGHVPFTRRAKKVLELSLREALALKHNYIADGHILLGLLREGGGIAARIITNAGIDADALRAEIKDELT